MFNNSFINQIIINCVSWINFVNLNKNVTPDNSWNYSLTNKCNLKGENGKEVWREVWQENVIELSCSD